MAVKIDDAPNKYYWSTPTEEFVATNIPTPDEIYKHFMLENLDIKCADPLTFSSEDGESVRVLIFYQEKASRTGLILRGWLTDIKFLGADGGYACKKCAVYLGNNDATTARVVYEKEHNQQVWDILVRESGYRMA